MLLIPTQQHQWKEFVMKKADGVQLKLAIETPVVQIDNLESGVCLPYVGRDTRIMWWNGHKVPCLPITRSGS